MTRKRARRTATAGLLVARLAVVATDARPQTRGSVKPSSTRSTPTDHVIRVLGGATKFAAPVTTVAALKKMAERNYDYRGQWTATAGPAGEGAQ